MKSLTPEQVCGTRFEIWVEELLKDNGYWLVRRNVQYYQQRYIFRQVDVEFRDLNIVNPFVLFNSLVIMELKYSNVGYVHLDLRGVKKKSGQVIRRIDTIINELEERRRFVDARKAILTTNGYFSKEVHSEVGQYRAIELWEKDQLEDLDRQRRGLMDFLFPKISLDNIDVVDVKKYELGAVKQKIGYR